MLSTRWAAAAKELRARGQWPALRTYVDALLPVLDRLRDDPRVGDVSVQVSHATLVFSVSCSVRRVAAGWSESGSFEISYVEPSFAFSEMLATESEQAAVDAIAERINSLRATGTNGGSDMSRDRGGRHG